MKINFFSSNSQLYEFRWFIIIAILITCIMVWHDLAGGRMFYVSSQQHWSSSGPGYHK